MAEGQIEKALECSICLDVPPCLTYRHIICGICKEKLSKCRVCPSKRKLSVSPVAERISREFGFKSKCPRYETGCHGLIPSAEMKEHITQQCYQRDVMCSELKTEACQNVSIPFGDFAQHLNEKHKCSQSQVSGIVQRSFKELQDGARWPLETVKKDDLTFLMHSYFWNGVAYFWTTVLGDKETALKNVCELILEPLDQDTRTKSCIWTLPVLPYHDYSEFKDPMPLVTAIPATLLLEFCKREEVGQRTEWQYTFKMTYSIL